MNSRSSATVRQCDWRAPLRGLERYGEVDHILTDPPYSPQVHDRGRARAEGGQLGFDAIDPEGRRECAAAFGLARRWTIVFSDLEGAGDWCDAMTDAGIEPVRVGVWIKIGAAPQMTGDRPGNGVEALVIGHRRHSNGNPMAKRWHGGGRHATWRVPRVTRPVHPTEKPVALMEALLRDFTDVGDLIADPFAGRGATLVAAVRCGRRAIGWERQPKWARSARRRVSQARRQFDLFE